MTPELRAAILASARRLGISPVDLGTAISYETAGTFDPWKAGPRTQWGQHRGLIQWGEPQRQRYGVTQGMPVAAQMQAVERYLTDAGVRPGMGLLDVYSAINAGRVGRYNASDAGNGGAPGTVADKVRNQMTAHMRKAEAFLGGSTGPGTAASTTPSGSAAPAASAGLLPADAASPPGSLAAMYGSPVDTGLLQMADAPVSPMQLNLLQQAQGQREAAAQQAERRKRLFSSDGLAGLYG